MTKLNPGRLAAIRTLISVDEGAHADDMLAQLAPDSGSDRALAWHLVQGTLRRRGTLDGILASAARRSIDAIDPGPRAALRIGLFEVNCSRTPIHAAIDQAVEGCRAVGARHATGFVNAVLRRAAKSKLPDDPFLDLPVWLAERWADHADWVARLRDPAPLCGVSRTLDTLPADLQTAPVDIGGQAIPGAFRVVAPQGPIDQMPGFAAGEWWVMDPGAVAVADLLWSEVPRTDAPTTVLDACAAPGGKSFRLGSRGAQVLAVDQSPVRLARLAEGAQRLSMSIPTLSHDWEQGPLPESPTFDAVLVDAPCTGLGTVRRHPEIRWLRLPSDPAAMAVRQRIILAAASIHVRAGGILVYAVCSPMPEEGIEVADSLDGWRVDTTLSTSPPLGDEDAFQAFVLRRISPTS